MLEEKNDNLLNADGENLNQPLENSTPDNETVNDNDALKEISNIRSTEGQALFTAEQETVNKNTATQEIENSNAEEGEDEANSKDYTIPIKNYETFSMEQLADELKTLVNNEKALALKDHIEEVKKEFYTKYNHLIEEKKEEFSNENNGDATDFEYHFPLKQAFDTLYNQYRDKKNSHFKKLQSDLKSNLEKRLAIIEELKSIIESEENIQDALKHVNELREKWKTAGSIPRDKYNHVWNNFHFHIERFYDHLHLDREARDMDFKHNLEQKERIITRVEELLKEEDINKAFRELQSLHKIWKEEIGPVSREQREEIWNRFSELTKQLHDKREGLFVKMREKEQDNLNRKKEIISQIQNLATEKVHSHSAWQEQINKIDALREQFFQAGKVPLEVNEETWTSFKNAVRDFNSLKNSFYKDIKKDQQTNMNKKTALVEKAKSLKDSDDFSATTLVMKQIQDEWKNIGHVPRKFSDSLWKEFKEACNHYFDRLHAHRNEANKEEIEAFENKKEFLEQLKSFELTGDHKTDLDAIKKHIDTWKSIGKVPQARRHIEGKFNKILDALFDKLSLSKKEADMVKFSNRLEQLAEGENSRQLENEEVFIRRKIDEVKSEILQLENNIQFISNAKADNPFIKEVNKSIERHKEELNTWKEKLKQLRNFKHE